MWYDDGARQAIEKRNDTTMIWVPPPKAPFGPQPTTAHTKTTYAAFEDEKVKGMLQQNLIVCVLMAVMSFKFGIHLPLVRVTRVPGGSPCEPWADGGALRSSTGHCSPVALCCNCDARSCKWR